MTTTTEPFIGRSLEIARLESIVGDAVGGFGRVVAIAGDPGAGKTRLVRDCVPRVEARGARTVWTVCAHAESAPPFWPWSELLRRLLAGRDTPLPRHLGLLAKLIPEHFESPPPEVDETHARFLLFSAVTDLLSELAREQPLVIVLDDVHAADPGSLRLLLHLVRYVHALPIVAIATMRTAGTKLNDDQRMVIEELSAMWEEISLGALSRLEVLSFLEAYSGQRQRVELADHLWERTGGNAFFVDRLLRSVKPEKLDNLGQSTPASVKALIGQRLRLFGPDGRRVLNAFAVIGRPARPELVAAVSGVSEECVLKILGDAEADGLIEPFQGAPGEFSYRHELVGTCVYETVAPTARLELHQTVADALSRASSRASASSSAEVARHWLAASALGSGQRAQALHYSRLAGQDALQAAAWETAVDWCRHAVSLSLGPKDNAELLVALGRAELAAGHNNHARATFRDAIAAAHQIEDPRLLAEASLGFSRTSEAGAVDREAVDALRGAIEQLPADNHTLRARVLSEAAKRLWPDPANAELCKTFSQDALRAARAAGDLATLIFVLDARLVATAGPQGLGERLEAVAELDALDYEPTLEQEIIIHRWRLNTLLQTGESAAAREVVTAYGRAAERSRWPRYAYNAALRRCYHPVLEGRYEDAVVALDEAREIGNKAGDSHADAAWCVGRWIAAHHRLDGPQTNADTRALLEQMESHADRLVNLALYQACRLQMRLAHGDRDGARTALMTLATQSFAAINEDFFTLATYAILSDVVIELDDRACAELLLERQLPYTDQAACVGAYLPLGAVATHAANLAAFLGDPRADSLAETGRRLNEAMNARPWLGHNAAVPKLSSASTAGESKPLAVLNRESDDVWCVQTQGESHRVRHSRGMDFLAVLLSRPGTAVAAVELAGVASELRQQGSGPMLDPEAKDAYRKRVLELREELAEAEADADLGRVERYRAELEFISQELASAVGLGGRDREQGSSTERARSSVTRALRRAIKAIAKVDNELAAHLDLRVQTGRMCTYTPEGGGVVLVHLAS